jgi:hypothetical protein
MKKLFSSSECVLLEMRRTYKSTMLQNEREENLFYLHPFIPSAHAGKIELPR